MNFLIMDAWLNIKSQGLKTFFSVLSMIVGLAAFYVLLTVKCQSEFAKNQLLEAMGAHRFVAQTSDQKVTINNINNLKNKLALFPYELMYKSDKQLVFVEPAMFPILNLSLASGRFFNKQDSDLNSKTAVIGFELAKKLNFNYARPYIQIEQQGFEVVGVLNTALLNPLFDFEVNDSIFLDLSVIKRFDFEGVLHNFLVDNRVIDFDQFTKIMDDQYGEYPIYFRYPELFIQAVEQQAKEMMRLLTGITVITLVLGLVGVFSMQWMSLLSRRCEFGMRLSIGARPIDLACLFFMENSLLIIGSLSIGLVAGVISSVFFKVTTRFFWVPISGTFILSCIIGIISGVPVAFVLYRSRPANLLAYS